MVSKGYTLSHAGLVVSITGFLGSAIGIAAPHYASKLKNMRMFLFWMGIMVALSFAALIFDSGWRLIIWLLISNIGLSVTFPLSLLLTVTRSIDAGRLDLSQSWLNPLVISWPPLLQESLEQSLIQP